MWNVLRKQFQPFTNISLLPSCCVSKIGVLGLQNGLTVFILVCHVWDFNSLFALWPSCHMITVAQKPLIHVMLHAKEIWKTSEGIYVLHLTWKQTLFHMTAHYELLKETTKFWQFYFFTSLPSSSPVGKPRQWQWVGPLWSVDIMELRGGGKTHVKVTSIHKISCDKMWICPADSHMCGAAVQAQLAATSHLRCGVKRLNY